MLSSILRNFLLASLMLSTLTVEAFVPQPHANRVATPTTTTSSISFENSHRFSSNSIATTTTVSTTRLQQAKVDDGSARGLPILALVLLACVWTFTIPPEFRRAYICPDSCAKVEYQAAPQCQTCVTGEEWVQGIKEYYQNGGGIQWDFSIDPNSKMKL